MHAEMLQDFIPQKCWSRWCYDLLHFFQTPKIYEKHV